MNNWQRIRFKCTKCNKESWIEFDTIFYVMNDNDLICDECNPAEEAIEE